MISIHTQPPLAQAWLDTYRGQRPHFVCILGFTNTCLIPGISAAGLTPHDREFTALADGEFLRLGVQPTYQYPLPPLIAGASPAIITRAILDALDIPITILNSGLPHPPGFDCVDLGGQPAACLSTGRAMSIGLVQHLWQQGLTWGEKLGQSAPYLVIGECVVGGTTTALALLTALGVQADGKVNSSHPQCNHDQKKLLVEQGLKNIAATADPWGILAAIGDPMQVVTAGMAVAASRQGGVLLAGGTQMLAVYALIQKLGDLDLTGNCRLDRIAVGTTGWVANDLSADAVGLAQSLSPAIFLSAQLQFADSGYEQLQVYDQGFVKEGVGAGGSAIAAALHQGWGSREILAATESLMDALSGQQLLF
jgi:uncharacterized protein (TIGR00303 family)